MKAQAGARARRDTVVALDEATARGWARRTVYGEGGVPGTAWRVLARPLALAWRAAARHRLDHSAGSDRPPAPAISVGNVTVGGSGKTSLVRWIIAHGLPDGARAAVLARGYRSEGAGLRVLRPGGAYPATRVGDEPALLARDGAWVGVGADRMRAAVAVAEVAKPDLFVLDDALQHRRIARALDLVTFTAGDLEAPALCLPAGPLRQGPGWRPPEALWIVIGEDPRERVHRRGTIGAAFAGWWRELPGSSADWEDAGTVPLAAWAASRDEERFDAGGRPVVGLAAVAHPRSVADFAARAGHPVERVAAFGDHHPYRPGDILDVRKRHPEAAFVTTEKDAVKLDPAWFGERPVGVLRRRLVPVDPVAIATRIRDAIAWR